MSDKLICQVYAGSRREETYLYVDKAEDLSRVPEALLSRFGTIRPVMVLVLTSEKKLARVDVNDVIQSIRDKGFYLQMPPERDVYGVDPYRTPVQE